MTHQNIAVISCQKNILNAPEYSHIIKNRDENGFDMIGGRYPIVWRHNKLFGSIDPSDSNQICFGNTSAYGGCVRKFNNGVIDYSHEAFTYIYYPSTKELYCIGLCADEARFGGIVVMPMMKRDLARHRVKYLMNKWRRLTPLIGKWALFFNQFYTEVTYRPGNLGSQSAIYNLKKYVLNIKY